MNTDWHDLIQRHIDGLTTDEEAAHLQDSLKRDDAVVRRYLRYMNLDVALEAHAGSRAMVNELLMTPPQCESKRWTGSFPWRSLAAAAAVMGICLSLWNRPQESKPVVEEAGLKADAPREVAVVTQVVDTQWNDVVYQTTDRVPAGKFSLKAGLVRLQFLSGATAVIEGPAELDLTSERGGEVLSGLITVTVPPVAEGFTLVAAGWRAVDRGTVFGIDARSPEHTEVHVIEGKVDMHQGMDVAVRSTLTTGQTARLTAKSLVEQEAATANFPREADVIDRAARASQSEFEAWKRRSNTLATDPSLALYLDFEATDAERGIIRNRAPGAAPRSDATVIGGEWTQGRWPGKSAVAFQRVGDLVRTSLRTQLNAGTFIVSLRFDAESPLAQTILLSPHVGPGQIYWLFDNRHRPRPGVGFVFIKTGEQQKNLRLVSQRLLLPPEMGRWHTVAVVHDPAHHRVRHYLDGQLIKENPLHDDTRLNLEQIVIGNWGFTADPRHFTGRMDELAVFKRALSDEEIAKF